MSKLIILPAAFVILFTLTCVITYCWAAGVHKVDWIYTFISDAGTLPPISSVFDQMLHILCLLEFAIVYIRYKQVAMCFKAKNSRSTKLNTMSLVSGILSAVGLSMVANFPENTFLILHGAGATLVFLGGSTWQCINAYLTFKLLPEFSSKAVGIARTGIACLGALFTLVFVIGGPISFAVYGNTDLMGSTMLAWAKQDKSWGRGVVVISEWITVFLSILFFVTLIPEFNQLRLLHPRVVVIGESTDLTQEGDSKETVETKLNPSEPYAANGLAPPPSELEPQAGSASIV